MQFRSHASKFPGGRLTVGGSLRRALRGLSDRRDVLSNFGGPFRRLCNIAADFVRRRGLLFNGAGDCTRDVVDFVNDLADLSDGFNGTSRIVLDRLDFLTDVLGRLGSSL